MYCILLKDDSLLRILRFPGYSKPRYFELFSISLGTSKYRGSTVHCYSTQGQDDFPKSDTSYFLFITVPSAVRIRRPHLHFTESRYCRASFVCFWHLLKVLNYFPIGNLFCVLRFIFCMIFARKRLHASADPSFCNGRSGMA